MAARATRPALASSAKVNLVTSNVVTLAGDAYVTLVLLLSRCMHDDGDDRWYTG